MKSFEYIIIFISIVLGLTVSESITTIAMIIRDKPDITFYFPLTLWFIMGITSTIYYFFSMYHLQKKIISWSMANFSIILVTSALLVINFYLILPINSNVEFDPESYYKTNRITLYFNSVLLMLFFIIELAVLYKSKQTIRYVILVSMIVILISGILIPSTTTDYVVSISLLTMVIPPNFIFKWVKIRDTTQAMASHGETNLKEILKSLKPRHNPGDFVFCQIESLNGLDLNAAVMTFGEKEGTTVIIKKELADQLNLSYIHIFSWITLTVHSSLTAIGLTAAFSKALAEKGISCNVVAAHHHDHIFVGKDDLERAMNALVALSNS